MDMCVREYYVLARVIRQWWKCDSWENMEGNSHGSETVLPDVSHIPSFVNMLVSVVVASQGDNPPVSVALYLAWLPLCLRKMVTSDSWLTIGKGSFKELHNTTDLAKEKNPDTGGMAEFLKPLNEKLMIANSMTEWPRFNRASYESTEILDKDMHMAKVEHSWRSWFKRMLYNIKYAIIRTWFEKIKIRGVVYDNAPKTPERWHASGIEPRKATERASQLRLFNSTSRASSKHPFEDPFEDPRVLWMHPRAGCYKSGIRAARLRPVDLGYDL
ncbi:hypothetical protein Tco_0669024 [Tanacetum coccineum]